MALGMATRSKHPMPGHRPGRETLHRSKTAPPVTVHSTSSTLDEERKLLFSMDYGTKTLSIAYRVTRPGEAPSASGVYDVHFSERDYHAPQAAVWAKDGTFYWGYGVDRALKQKLIRQEDIIELWKLLLYKAHETSDLAKLVKTQLGQRKVGDLISTHLKAVIKEAKRQIKSAQTLELSAEDVDNLPMQLFLSVPQMWKGPANKVMTDAAKAAGIDYVELFYEPQCAAAFFTHNIKDRQPKQLTVGDVLLIADIGGGTGDFVSYEFKSDCDSGAKVGLKMVGTAEGALCGSEFVNQNFIAWLKKQAGTKAEMFEAKCKELGLTSTACIKQASASFEGIKTSFSVTGADSEWVTIRGAQGAKTKAWDLELTSKDIEGFFKPVVAQIIKCIEAQKTDRTKVLIIPGGFGRSEYLLDELKAKYGDELTIMGRANNAVGAYQPVSRGALLRYKDILTRGMPSKESFGIGQVESWDPKIHPDATISDSETGKKRKCSSQTRPNMKIVEKDPYDGSLIVYERWLSIMRKGQLKVPGQAFATDTWQQYLVQDTDNTMSVQVYWTEQNIADHDPILTGANVLESSVRPGIELWGEPLTMPVPDLEELGFEAYESEEKGLVYEIYWRLVLKCNGANVSVEWQIALPGTEPYDETGAHRPEGASNVQLTDNEVFTLCDASYNPFPRVATT